jgi:hypothetical protein
MPSNDKIRALVTSVDRFTVYNPKPITKKFQEDKAFYVLGERIEIKHVHGSKIEAPDVDIMQRSVSSLRRKRLLRTEAYAQKSRF